MVEIMSNFQIKVLNLSSRARNVLAKMHITTTDELIGISMDELTKQRNVGAKTVDEIKMLIEQLKNHSILPQIKLNYSSGQLQEMSAHSIKELGLSIRSYHVLVNHNLLHIDQVAQLSEEDYSEFDGAGKKTIQDIKDSLNNWVRNHLVLSDFQEAYFNCGGENTENEVQQYVCPIPLTDAMLDEMSNHSVSELSLSVRPNRVLMENSIETIDQLAKLELDKLHTFKSLGNRSINEIQDAFNAWLNENALLQNALTADVAGDDDHIKVVNDCVKILEPIYNISSGKLYKLLVDEEKLELLDLTDEEESRTYNFKLVLSLDALHKQIESFWDKLLLDGVDLKEGVLEKILDLNVFEPTLLLQDGVQKRYILAVDNYYILNRKHFSDAYFEKYGEESKASQILKMRLNGMILQDIGDTFEVTRERARQISVKEVNKIYKPFEDAFLEPFQSFAIEKEDFIKAFPEIDGQGYEYLRIRYKRGKNELNPDTLASYTGIWKERLVSFYERKMKESERKSMTSIKIIMRILIDNSDTSMTMEELMEKYYLYLRENNYPEDSRKYNLNDRTLNNHLRNAKNIVYDRSNKVRFCSPEIELLKREIDFERYKGLVISAELIFRDYEDLMEEQDIRDGYELFYVLKNSDGIFDDTVDVYFRRVPSIVFDGAQEDEQAVRFLKEYSPYDMDDYYAAYEQRFGIRRDSARGNPVISNAIFPYFLAGKYVENVAYISDLDSEVFKKKLQEKTIWFIDDLEKVFKEICVHSSSDALNKIALHKVGYTLNIGYAYNSMYESATEYLEKEIFTKDILDLRKLDGRLTVLNLFSSALDKKRLNLEFIECGPKIYLSRQKLLEVYGLTTEEVVAIQSLITKIDDAYFNGNSIWEKVKDYPLIDKLQENRWLLTGILHQQPHVYSLRVKGNKILSKTDTLNLANVCVWLAEQYGRKTIYEMTQLFNSVYGCEIEAYKLAAKIKQDGKWNQVITDSMDNYLEELSSNIDDEEDLFAEQFF